MNSAVYILVQFVTIFLDVILIAMLVRAVLSWFPIDSLATLNGFLYVVTEPLILPVRALCARLGWFQGSPLDFSFLITALLLSLATSLLSGMVA